MVPIILTSVVNHRYAAKMMKIGSCLTQIILKSSKDSRDYGFKIHIDYYGVMQSNNVLYRVAEMSI